MHLLAKYYISYFRTKIIHANEADSFTLLKDKGPAFCEEKQKAIKCTSMKQQVVS